MRTDKDGGYALIKVGDLRQLISSKITSRHYAEIPRLRSEHACSIVSSYSNIVRKLALDMKQSGGDPNCEEIRLMQSTVRNSAADKKLLGAVMQTSRPISQLEKSNA